MSSEIGRSATRLENVYFPNNEQPSTTVFTTMFYFTHADHNLIKLKLFNNWLAQAFTSISECVIRENQRNQSNLLTFKN